MNVLSETAAAGFALSSEEVAALVAQAFPAAESRGKRVLCVIPDATRTAPVGLLFQSLFRQIGAEVKSLDILVALGTHQPMSEAAICQRLEITEAERAGAYKNVRLFNH